MKTNNAKVKNIIISLYFILIVLAVLFATLFSVFQDLTGDPVLTFFLVLFGFIVLFLISNHNPNKIKIESFNVTLVSRKKIKYIRQSLNKMIRENRKKQA